MSVNFRANQKIAVFNGARWEWRSWAPASLWILEEVKIEERKEECCGIFAQKKNFGARETAVASERL
jgi:hypothetical protein